MFLKRPWPAVCRNLLRIAFVVSVLMWVPAEAAMAAPEGPVILPVWRGEVPGKPANVEEETTINGRVVNVSTPMMYAYVLPGVRPAPAAVVICPGGGYSHLSMEREGHDVARWLNSLGIAAVVLKYRFSPYHHPIPLDDARQAVSEVRRRAKELNIDPWRLGIIGFSAGGHLAATVMTAAGQTPMDRPDFGILAYPVISMDDESLVHKGSRESLLGPDFSPEEARRLSANLNVTPSCPPAFIFHAKDDSAVPVGNSEKMYEALQAKGIDSELFLVDRGGHGFGLDIPEVNKAIERWLDARGLTGVKTLESQKSASVDQMSGGVPDHQISGANRVRIFIAGDSTACDYEASRAPRTGWGQTLGEYFDPDRVEVINRAQSGRSSKSFMDEGELDKIARDIKPGDYLWIQFGHNDEKEANPKRYTDPATTFPQTLKKYIEAARNAGAQPVLLTPVVRRRFEDGRLADSHGGYLTAVRKLAREENVPLIDMAAMSEAFFNDVGEEKSKQYFMHLVPGESSNYPEGAEDDTHFQKRGAEAMARLAVEGIRELGLPLAGSIINQRK
jgi:acetyl esterase/lipase/lysophospholipase L1-like esterase